jgi:hypothetical protein
MRGRAHDSCNSLTALAEPSTSKAMEERRGWWRMVSAVEVRDDGEKWQAMNVRECRQVEAKRRGRRG